jgi:hypothetical protein
VATSAPDLATRRGGALDGGDALKERCKEEGVGNKGPRMPKTYNKEDFCMRITLDIKITVSVNMTVTIPA